MSRLESWVSSKDPNHRSHVAFKQSIEQKMSRNLARAAGLIELKDPNGVIGKFAKHMQKPDAAGIVIANHDQHVNVASFLKTAKVFNAASTKEVEHTLLVTLSLTNGLQGLGFQQFALGMRPTLLENNMSMLGIMREKDKYEYYRKEGEEIVDGSRKIGSHEDLKRDADLGARNLRLVRKRMLNGGVIWFFPAGTTSEGAKNPETGKEYGMDSIQNELISFLMNAAQRQNRDLKILPLSLNGHNRIVPARQEKATAEAKRAYTRNMLVGRFIGSKYLAEAIPGELIGPEDILADGINLKDGQEVNNFVLKRVASNVVPERRGIFA